MKCSTSKALHVAAAATLAIAAAPIQNSAQAFEEGIIQTLQVTSTRGTSEMHQFYREDTGSRARTRICVVNFGDVPRAFTHTVPGIRALVAPPGGRSCANFSSQSRVAFGLVDGTEPAQANKAMVMSLGAFAGGTVRFFWQ